VVISATLTLEVALLTSSSSALIRVPVMHQTTKFQRNWSMLG